MDRLRVSRRGGGYRLRFATGQHRPLVPRVIGSFQEHVGEHREKLDAGRADREADSPDFKLVRGFAKILACETTVETRAPCSRG